MTKRIIILSIIILFLSLVSQRNTIAQSRENLPNDFGIELLGKALLYSFSYQRTVGNHLGIEFGLSAFGGSGDMVIFIPLGARIYFMPTDASMFITGGVVAVTASTSSGPFSDNTLTYGNAGLGFEYRSSGGLLFRGTAYGLFASGGVFIWPGLYIGYAF